MDLTPTNRLDAFFAAKDLVDQIVETHGLEDYSLGAVFNSTARYTKVEQHVGETIRVAEWLLGDGL